MSVYGPPAVIGGSFAIHLPSGPAIADVDLRVDVDGDLGTGSSPTPYRVGNPSLQDHVIRKWTGQEWMVRLRVSQCD